MFLKDLACFDENLKRFKIKKVKETKFKKSRSFLDIKKDDISDLSNLLLLINYYLL